MKKNPNCYSTSKRNTLWNTSNKKEVTEVTIPKVATSATKNILNAELSIVEEEMQSMKISKEMLESMHMISELLQLLKSLLLNIKNTVLTVLTVNSY